MWIPHSQPCTMNAAAGWPPCEKRCGRRGVRSFLLKRWCDHVCTQCVCTQCTPTEMTRVWIGGFSRLSAAAPPFTIKTFYSHSQAVSICLGGHGGAGKAVPCHPHVPGSACHRPAWPGKRQRRLGRGVSEGHQCQVTRDQTADRGLCHPASRPEDNSGSSSAGGQGTSLFSAQ